MSDGLFLLIAIVTGLATAVGFFVLVGLTAPRRETVAAARPETDCAFQFLNGSLIDQSDEARLLMSVLNPRRQVSTFQDLAAILSRRFPSFPSSPPSEAMFLRSADTTDSGMVEIQVKGPYTRVSLSDRDMTAADLELLHKTQRELEVLRRAMSNAPDPMWEETTEGVITWTNAAYDALLRKSRPASADNRLFSLPLPQVGTGQVRRDKVEIVDRATPSWFEIDSRPAGAVWLRYATNIDAVVHAETTQRNFVQTLAKTFAHLPTGLAIFDRNRFLALFNPAMVDLTGLSAELLGARPSLMAFFDHLREAQIMPEPKDYRTWRERLAELVAAASDDRYSETWSLPSGLTYRVIGRPHPDGAIAFLFEDISAEVSLTRRFRSEMEISQSVLDSFEDAVAVFSQVGVLTITNAAYRQLWASDPSSSFSELTIVDATRLWRKLCEPNGSWVELRDFVTVRHDRASWEFEVAKLSGEALICHVDPIPGASTLVRFSRRVEIGARPVAGVARTVA